MKRKHAPVYYHVRLVVRVAFYLSPAIAITVLMHVKAFLG